jgi:malonyl-CoA decarboxylase
LSARGKDGRPHDPVAKFHLGNGAELALIHWMADSSAKGVRESFGLMVNYLYDLKHIEQNQASLTKGVVSASSAVHKLARADASHPRQNGKRNAETQAAE